MVWATAALLLPGLAAATASRVPDFGPGFTPSTQDNMNGEYPHTTTPGGTPGLFPTRYRDYLEVWSRLTCTRHL